MITQHNLLHLLVGYALTLTLLQAHVKPIPALLITTAVGIGKEVYDGRDESMRAHARDVGLTTGAGILALGVHLTFR